MLCVMINLKSDTEYIIRVAARNIVGYSVFTVKQSSTEDATGNNWFDDHITFSRLFSLTF